MPANYLTKARSVHLNATLKVYGETEVREGGVYVWFAAEAGGTSYTVPVACAVQRPKRKSMAVAGLLEMEQTDEVAVHCNEDDLPFVPDPAADIIFVVATAVMGAEGLETSSEDARKYVLKSYTDPAPGSTAVRFTGRLHS